MTAAAPRSSAAWICRHWVSLYTRNLPVVERQRRREELDSDLFEHALEARTAGAGPARLNAEILARVLVGVPADLSWRRATQQPQTRLDLGGTSMSLSKSNANRLLNILGGLVIALVWVSPVILVIVWVFGTLPESDISWQMKTFWMGLPLLAAATLALGLKIRTHSPRRGLHLIIAGALGPAIWFWLLPIYAPIMIAIIALAVSVTPRKQTRLATT